MISDFNYCFRCKNTYIKLYDYYNTTNLECQSCAGSYLSYNLTFNTIFSCAYVIGEKYLVLNFNYCNLFLIIDLPEFNNLNLYYWSLNQLICRDFPSVVLFRSDTQLPLNLTLDDVKNIIILS
jgi:hypothetical protein